MGRGQTVLNQKPSLRDIDIALKAHVSKLYHSYFSSRRKIRGAEKRSGNFAFQQENKIQVTQTIAAHKLSR
jgi:hypothetical protein